MASNQTAGRRKKPIVVEGVQYTEYGKLVRGMCNSQSCYSMGNTEPHVHTIHDTRLVLLAVGDFIIPEPDGEHFYTLQPGYPRAHRALSSPSPEVSDEAR